HVRLENRGIVGVARDRLGIVEVVETQVQRAPGSDGDAVGADRLPVGEEDGDRDMRIAVAGVDDAGGLVRDQRAVGERALRRNVTLGDGPALASNALHGRASAFPPKMSTSGGGLRFRPRELFSGSGVDSVHMCLRGGACVCLGSTNLCESAGRGRTAPRGTCRDPQQRGYTRGSDTTGEHAPHHGPPPVRPVPANSARLDDVPDPPPADGAILVRTWALGVCGTDREILSGAYGDPPPGERRLVLGHESLGEVIEAPAGCGVARGDLVVGIVRRPDPAPCPAGAVGDGDMGATGRYTERGIKERHGYGVERFRIEPEFAVKVDPALGILGVLLEPASILAKAWDHTERIGRRARGWAPRTVLVTGAGPIGLLAALMGVQRNLDVHALDHNEGGPTAALVRDPGGTYHSAPASLERLAPDILMECTGAAALICSCLDATAAAGIVCLTGVTEPGKVFDLDIGHLNRTIVLDNNVIFGTVNANRRHYEMAATALARADKNWLSRLITRTVPVERWSEALEYRKGEIKVIIDFRP